MPQIFEQTKDGLNTTNRKDLIWQGSDIYLILILNIHFNMLFANICGTAKRRENPLTPKSWCQKDLVSYRQTSQRNSPWNNIELFSYRQQHEIVNFRCDGETLIQTCVILGSQWQRTCSLVLVLPHSVWWSEIYGSMVTDRDVFSLEQY